MVANESELQTPLHQGRTKEYFWRKALARYKASGLSQVDFCKQENLNPGKFSWWKREIKLRDAESKSLQGNADKHGSEAYWRRIVAKFNRSGLSKDDFCAKESIKPQAFVWWRGELGRRDAAKISDVARPLAAASELFVPIRTPAQFHYTPANDEPKAIAELDLRNQTLRIFDNVTSSSLALLLNVLKELVN